MIYRLLRPVYRPDRKNGEPYFTLAFEVVRLLRAATAEDAIKASKKAGFGAPIIEPAKEQVQ